MKYLNILFVILVSVLTVLLIADSVNAIGDFIVWLFIYQRI